MFPWFYLVRPTGFEPVTLCLEGRCSIQLSYERILFYIDKFKENCFGEKMKSSIHDDIVTKVVFNHI
jgi:hypothetical protein